MGFIDSIKGVFGRGNVTKGYTETTTRPSIAQPYMSTDTGAKLPIFPFPLIMIYELADNIDALRIPIETINREMFKNGFEVVEKWKYKCSNCSKEFQYEPAIGDKPDDQPFESNDDSVPFNALPKKKGDIKKQTKQAELQCDTCGSHDLKRPIPEHRSKLEELLNNPVNGNDQNLEDVARQLERDLEIADNAYLLILKNYYIDDVSNRIDPDRTEIKEFLRVDPPQVAMIADSDGRIGYDDKRNPIYVCPKFEHRDRRLSEPVCERC